MRVTEIVQIVNGTPNRIYYDREINHIRTDSREIIEGDVFLTINAGYLYVEEATQRGAVAIITNQQVNQDDILIINVANSLEALKSLGCFLRDQYTKPVVAITGSVGKTTTKEFISGVLSSTRNVLKNEGNKNNIIGICTTLLKIEDSYDCVVLEVGMNHLGEIHDISLIIKPTISIITSIGSSHLGFLKNKRNILKAKMEIMDGNPYSLLILNGEDKYLKRKKGIKCCRKDFPYRSIFSHLQMNYTLTIRTCLLMGVPYDSIVHKINEIPLYRHRMNIIYKESMTIIDDSYNASYESILGGLDYISRLEGRKIVILGDILELGSFGRKIHKKLIKPLKKLKNSMYFLVGKEFDIIPFGYHFETTDDLVEFMSTYRFQEDDTIYIKASHAWGFEKVVDFF